MSDTSLAPDTFEKDWRKKLVGSNKKAREWLFRHAVEVYEFQQACKKEQLDGLGGPKSYFKQKVEEWLGYSSDLANKWAKAGSFIKSYETRIGETKRTGSSQLPASMSTLAEYSRMDKEEYAACEAAGLVHPNIARAEVKAFRAEYNEAKQKEEAEAERKHKAHTDEAESLLAFKYADNVPEWIIERIEDMVAEGVLDPTTKATSMKFPDGDTTWVLTLHLGLWSATEHVQAEEKPKKEKPTGGLAEWKQHMQALGVDVEGKRIESWALKALTKAAKQQHHPDKDTGSNGAFLAVTAAEEFFSNE